MLYILQLVGRSLALRYSPPPGAGKMSGVFLVSLSWKIINTPKCRRSSGAERWRWRNRATGGWEQRYPLRRSQVRILQPDSTAEAVKRDHLRRWQPGKTGSVFCCRCRSIAVERRVGSCQRALKREKLSIAKRQLRWLTKRCSAAGMIITREVFDLVFINGGKKCGSMTRGLSVVRNVENRRKPKYYRKPNWSIFRFTAPGVRKNKL